MGWRLSRKQGWLWGAALLLVMGCQGLSLYPPDGGPRPMYVVRIYFATLAERDRLAGELDVWEVHRPEGYLVARIDGGMYLTLAYTGWRVTPECATMRQLQDALDLQETTLASLCPL